MQKFQELKVWQRSHALALDVCRITASFPKVEQFGLTQQLRRAALSVPNNIAEGSKRKTRQEYARFLNIAEGSAGEVEYLLTFSRDMGYLPQEMAAAKLQEVTEIARMLNALRTKVEGGPA